MTNDEIKVVLEIMNTADGGCSACVFEMLHELNRRLPETITPELVQKYCDSIESEDREAIFSKEKKYSWMKD